MKEAKELLKLLDSVNEPLQTIDAPYLPPTKDSYTLVLDLDETLVHYQEVFSILKLKIGRG